MISTKNMVEQILADYTAVEDSLRRFTDRNFGRMCAICARWTMLAARTNAQTPREEQRRGVGQKVEWKLSSWVTNCCNANHALESMSEDSLAGIVASREEGRRWWETVERGADAPCTALTETGCALKRGRPELCNTYFCEAVRDYLWLIGGASHGAHLAGQLDELQRRWGRLYGRYQSAILDAKLKGTEPVPHRLRGETGWGEFLQFLERFDREIACYARPITSRDITDRLFKVSGEPAAYVPFFEREIESIGGEIRGD
jgi:hypothetical protein